MTGKQELQKDILQRGGYQGDIAVEGYHDVVYCGEREWEGRKMALEYLRKCGVKCEYRK